MKKVIVFFLLTFSLVPFDASENIDDSIKQHYKTSANLNVRKGAGKKHPIIFTLKKDDEVKLISKRDNWSEIKYAEKSGFVSSKYLIPIKISSDETFPSGKSIFFFILKIVFAFILLIITFNIYQRISITNSKKKDRNLLQTVTDLDRGTWSERDLVLKLLKYGISEQNIFHDLFIRTHKGNFSQIDLVVTTEVGLFVFEVKDYSGWIYGDGNKTKWTKVLAYGKQKYYFYNPILQNNKHIENLKNQLINFSNIPYFSIVVFYGNCELKDISFVPEGTFITKVERVFEVINLILNNNNKIEYSNLDKILNVLKESQLNGRDYKIQELHKENVKDMLGKHRVFE
ncbi:NERD domain-containing protein [Epilithonimonas xixisoli]|uniref:SH3 domain-containing protein n=1 Tax=Epilithonimonas xixisoli TaxID=1476462 RepID=A0A4R8IJW7_9FLAO|nr:NERD domain-containing protein [Epilithonimonas xixisoli]TDX86909.1 SH3 domain-containing protein [Epilithonimonas xixisoli]